MYFYVFKAKNILFKILSVAFKYFEINKTKKLQLFKDNSLTATK